MNDDYFKNETEIKQFFKGQTLKFTFKSGGQIFFETLYPNTIGGELFIFQLSFYENENDWFCYSALEGENGWLDKFQIAQVDSVSEVDKKHKELYFTTYNENYTK